MSDRGREDFELPLDSDLEVDDVGVSGGDAAGSAGAGRVAAGGSAAGGPAAEPDSSTRPPHLRPVFLLVVGVGGAVGTLCRYLLQQAAQPWPGVPLVTVAINVAGAFFLGLLLETLARRGDDAGRRRFLRLLLGTGALGGFTTYSALATDTMTLLHEGEALLGILYALVTVLAGAGAAVLGIMVGARSNRRQRAASAAAAASAGSPPASSSPGGRS